MRNFSKRKCLARGLWAHTEATAPRMENHSLGAFGHSEDKNGQSKSTSLGAFGHACVKHLAWKVWASARREGGGGGFRNAPTGKPKKNKHQNSCERFCLERLFRQQFCWVVFVLGEAVLGIICWASLFCVRDRLCIGGKIIAPSYARNTGVVVTLAQPEPKPVKTIGRVPALTFHFLC